jgi:hypothetical protein
MIASGVSLGTCSTVTLFHATEPVPARPPVTPGTAYAA